MSPDSKSSPLPEDISATLIAGLLIRPLPVAPLNRLLRHLANRIQNNHPAILDRLAPLAGKNFLICPTDLPHDMRLIIGETRVDCIIEDDFIGPAHVRISGSFLSLVQMMEGKVDGDALFFSRRLTVEGDTEALLTLRNALDSDHIDLRAEILELCGPLKAPASDFLKIGQRLYHGLFRDISLISRAMTRPLSRRCDNLEQETGDLKEKISHLEKMLGKTQNRLQSLNRKMNP